MSAVANNPLADIQRELAEFHHDPLGFVMCAYPWGQGELANDPGPRAHQVKFLEELGAHLENPATRFKPFRKAKSSGHGIGKTTEFAWVLHWGLSTFEDCKVIVLAGTGDQLKTKTQPECAKWISLAANQELFEVNVTSIKVREPGHETRWRADFNTWSEENPQATAGAHNKGKRLIILYDEACPIPNVIWQTQEGALTDLDTEIIWLAASQCTRSDGYFFEATHGTQRGRWRAEVIDSRSVEGVNVEEINQDIAIYGEDSDHVRVRWRGLYPLAGEGKFIPLDLVQLAQQRMIPQFNDDPLVAGVDLSWGGSDDTVIRFRRGVDARSIPAIKIRGEYTKNPAVIRERLVDVLRSRFDGQPVSMMFLDNSGVGGNAGAILAGLLNLGFQNVMGVNFGDAALHDRFYALRRDEMWGGMKDWMRNGGCIDSDRELAVDLQKPILMADREQRVKLEPKEQMKKRLQKMGLDSTSPDDADALALTFALPVATGKKDINVDPPQISTWMRGGGDGGWMGSLVGSPIMLGQMARMAQPFHRVPMVLFITAIMMGFGLAVLLAILTAVGTNHSSFLDSLPNSFLCRTSKGIVSRIFDFSGLVLSGVARILFFALGNMFRRTPHTLALVIRVMRASLEPIGDSCRAFIPFPHVCGAFGPFFSTAHKMA